jgi:hypothetical protein
MIGMRQLTRNLASFFQPVEILKVFDICKRKRYGRTEYERIALKGAVQQHGTIRVKLLSFPYLYQGVYGVCQTELESPRRPHTKPSPTCYIFSTKITAIATTKPSMLFPSNFTAPDSPLPLPLSPSMPSSTSLAVLA